MAVDCNGAGILLRTAEADCKLSDKLLFGQSSMAETQPLFFVKRLEDITTVPLLLLQVRNKDSVCKALLNTFLVTALTKRVN